MLRSRDDGAAAARVAAVLAAGPGWVLPEPAAGRQALPEGDGVDESREGWSLDRAGVSGSVARPAERSGRREVPEGSRDPLADDRAGAAADAPVPDPVAGGAPARWRLDPGRRGAVALVVAAALAAMAAAGVVWRGRPQEVPLPVVEVAGAPLPGSSPATAPSGEVVVSVGGEVARPGLVRLPAGSRVDDAVRAAGGPLAPDDLGLLNLARVLVDGEQVLVGVEPPPGAAPVAGAAPGGLLDLNTATAAQLEELPGVGPVLAQRIVDWRTENGRFASVDQLREVKGIGEATFADLEPKVAV